MVHPVAAAFFRSKKCAVAESIGYGKGNYGLTLIFCRSRSREKSREMVLWEMTLATAYFLGLKRTYAITLRIQWRASSALVAPSSVNSFTGALLCNIPYNSS